MRDVALQAIRHCNEGESRLGLFWLYQMRWECLGVPVVVTGHKKREVEIRSFLRQ